MDTSKRFQELQTQQSAGQPSVASTRPRGTSSRWEGASALPRELVKEFHTLDQSPLRQFAIQFAAMGMVSLFAVVAWNAGIPLLTFALWAIAGFLAHALPLATHDASHGTLHRSKRINEFLGLMMGTMILVPRSVYRYAHAQHHKHIATEKDPELWPFTVTTMPRWLRLLVAMTEIVFGFMYTPVLFVRSVLAADDIPKAQMKLIKREYVKVALFWGSSLTTIHYVQLWTPFLVGVVGPWVVAGWFQSLNKYVEHMGMMGVGVVGSTRSVVPEDEIGKSLAEAWQNVAYHGTHHLYAKIPYYKLPDASEHVLAEHAPEGTLFTSYISAFLAMVPTLVNPRIGAQWLRLQATRKT